MTFRKVLFWTHLAAGVTCGVIVFIMSITGAALALQPQILLWAERDARVVQPPSPDARWIGADALLAKVRESRPQMTITGVTLERDRTLAAAITMTKADAPAPAPGTPAPPQTTLWVDPYTGAVTGQMDPTSGWRRFFRSATDWHRWLAVSGEGRTAARWVTGVSNAAFLLLALTGMYIWLPRVWSRASVRAVAWFRPTLSGKARDFNWHNVIGIWSAPILVVLTFTGMCISFPKTYDVIYSVTGIERPPAAQPSPGAAQRGPREGDARAERGGDRTEMKPPAGPELGSVDAIWPLAESHLPTWRSIAMRLPARPGQPVTFTMNDTERVNGMARSTLTVDTRDARVVRWEPYEQLSTGQRLRTWMRFGHTGELWGITGQIVAGLASAGGCVLVWTGLALAWRRFLAWRNRRKREEPVVISEAA